VATRFFTVEEANEALETVRPLAEELVEHRRAQRSAQVARAAIAARISGNGAPGQARELAAASAEVERATTAIASCVSAIQEAGALVKDLDEGLVDFPARRGDEEVLLCWRVGEGEIAYWHGLDEGFAGRRPLPL
jgi:hypothetical protein